MYCCVVDLQLYNMTGIEHQHRYPNDYYLKRLPALAASSRVSLAHKNVPSLQLNSMYLSKIPPIKKSFLYNTYKTIRKLTKIDEQNASFPFSRNLIGGEFRKWHCVCCSHRLLIFQTVAFGDLTLLRSFRHQVVVRGGCVFLVTLQ